MVIGTKQRVLEKLAFRYWCKNNSRSEKENWELAEKLLKKLKIRYGK